MSEPSEIEETNAGWLVKQGNSVIAIGEREGSAQSIAERMNERISPYPDGVEPGEASNLKNYDLIELNRHEQRLAENPLYRNLHFAQPGQCDSLGMRSMGLDDDWVRLEGRSGQDQTRGDGNL